VYAESGVDEVENVYLPFPAGNQYARKTPWEGVFLSRLEGVTGLAYWYDFGWPILAVLVFARVGLGSSSQA
jgi:hypothetical protein